MGGAAVGFQISFAVSMLLGGPVIRLLKRVGARQTVSEDAPSRHAEKQGTTTMGGLLILAGIFVAVLFSLAEDPRYMPGLPLLGLTLAYGLIGLLDDYLIAARGKNLGLKARQKLVLQFAFAIAFVLWMRATAVAGVTTTLKLGVWSVDLGDGYYVLGALLIVGLSNAVNFTDGLDGLASGVTILVALALSASVLSVGALGWLPLFGGAVAGGCAGFLWFNAHPAQVFMGDTGSLALGAALAGMALIGKAEIPLQFYVAVPWAEIASVVVQVAVFKWRKRTRGIEFAREHRVFRRTPLHHHFEEIGWKETKIVARFWLATAVMIAVGFAVLVR
jgi:phospho-N-acetylmuramoyl-pentapeptide-transferase